MLSQRRHGIHARIARFPRSRRKQRRDRAGGRVHLAPALACLELRMLPHRVHVVHLSVGDLGVVQAPDDFFCGERGECIDDECTQFSARCATFGIGRKARIGRELRPLQDRLAEHRPLALVLQAEHHCLAITRREGPIGINGRVARAGTRWWLRTLERVVERVVHPFDERFEHRDVEMLPAPRAFPLQQCGKDTGVGVHAGGDIGN